MTPHEKKLAAGRRYREKNREKINAAARAQYAKNRESVNAEARRRYAEDPELRAKRQAANRRNAAKWNRENPERYKANKARSRARPDQRSKARSASAQWRRENPEWHKSLMAEWWLKPQNRARHRARVRERYREDPERFLAYEKLRRARKFGAGGTFNPDEWLAMIRRYSHRCAYCGKKKRHLTQDHVIPLTKGGRHEAANIVPACRPCNSSKGTGDWPKRVPRRKPAA